MPLAAPSSMPLLSRRKPRPAWRSPQSFRASSACRGVRGARGFVLLESLVAILIFVIGILGIVGLQAQITRVHTESTLRSEAAHLAQELVGLMWADIANLSGFAVSGGDCSAAACKLWLAKTQSVLPGGGASVSVGDIADGSKGSDVDVTVTWTMPGGEARKYMTRSTIALSHTP